MSKATPRPWHIDKDFPIITDNKGSGIADCNYCAAKSDEINCANAELIVRAVNCHDELVKVLYEAKQELLRRTNIDTDDWLFIDNIENLLKRAKSEV